MKKVLGISILAMMISAPLTLAAEEEKAADTYIYATYFYCKTSMQEKADEIVKAHNAPVWDAAVADGTVSGWGWVAHHTTDAWYVASPIGQTVWGLWPTGGAWTTRHLWEHYLYNGDRTFLEGRAWPVMAESAEFFLHYLSEDPQTGKLVSGPSSSPENRFKTEDGQVADGSPRLRPWARPFRYWRCLLLRATSTAI